MAATGARPSRLPDSRPDQPESASVRTAHRLLERTIDTLVHSGALMRRGCILSLLSLALLASGCPGPSEPRSTSGGADAGVAGADAGVDAGGTGIAGAGSFERIDAAEASGAIDAETALT